MENTYKYRAQKTFDKKIVEAVIDAKTEEEAKKKVQELGLEIISIEKLDHPDRRRHERFNIELELSYLIVKGEGKHGVEINGRTINISAGGLLFTTAENLRPGSIIDVIVEVEDTLVVEAMVRILRANVNEQGQFVIAACFVDLPVKVQVELDQFVMKRK